MGGYKGRERKWNSKVPCIDRPGVMLRANGGGGVVGLEGEVITE